VPLDVFARQDVDHLRIVEPGVELGIRDAILHRQALRDLVLGAERHVDEDFAQQLGLTPLVLRGEGLFEILDGQITPLDEQVTESRRRTDGRGGHGRDLSQIGEAGSRRQGGQTKLFTASITLSNTSSCSSSRVTSRILRLTLLLVEIFRSPCASRSRSCTFNSASRPPLSIVSVPLRSTITLRRSSVVRKSVIWRARSSLNSS